MEQIQLAGCICSSWESNLLTIYGKGKMKEVSVWRGNLEGTSNGERLKYERRYDVKYLIGKENNVIQLQVAIFSRMFSCFKGSGIELKRGNRTIILENYRDSSMRNVVGSSKCCLIWIYDIQGATSWITNWIVTSQVKFLKFLPLEVNNDREHRTSIETFTHVKIGSRQ